MDSCLADTGVNFYLIVGVGVGMLVLAFVLARSMRRPKHFGRASFFMLSLVFGAGLVGGGSQPVSAAQDRTPILVATASPDMSSGLQGEVQRFNVLTNDSPSKGHKFILSSMKIQPTANALAGTTSNQAFTQVIAPTEGEYNAEANGMIEFTPETNFIGLARGVAYSIEDTSGKTVRSTYRPTVTAVEVCEEAQPMTLLNREYQYDHSPYDENTNNFSLSNVSLNLSNESVYQVEDQQNLGVGSLTSGTEFRSFDTAEGWAPGSSHDARSLSVLTRSRDGASVLAITYVAGEDPHLLVSSDSGYTWNQITDYNPADMYRSPIAAISSDGSRIAIFVEDIGYNDSIFLSDDGGLSWSITPVPMYGTSGGIDDNLIMSGDGNTIAMIVNSENPDYDDYIVISTDGGDTWNGQFMGGNVESLSVSNDGQTIIAGNRATPGVRLSTDGGQSWSITDPTGGEPDVGSEQVYVSNDGDVLYAEMKYVEYGDPPRLFTSSNNGVSWQELTGMPVANLQELFTFFGDGSALYVLASDQDYEPVLVSSSNSGQTWQVVQDNYTQDFNPYEVDLDPSSPGQQLVYDDSSTSGYLVIYDPSADKLTIELNLETEDTPTSDHVELQYGLTSQCKTAEPAQIRIGFLSEQT
ncbi:MAG: hypothetical protein QG649_519 [Patescibacteria group bacterium]|nr:hypothetical protein [Patescibacteria group bacterium]